MSDPMTPVTRKVHTVDLALGPGRQVLRLALVGAGNEEDAALVISLGYGGGASGEPFTRPPWGELPLRIPADRIPELREKLATLENLTRRLSHELVGLASDRGHLAPVEGHRSRTLASWARGRPGEPATMTGRTPGAGLYSARTVRPVLDLEDLDEVTHEPENGEGQ